MERLVYIARTFLSTKAQNDWTTLLAVVGVLSLIAACAHFAYLIFTTVRSILAAIGSGIKAVDAFVKLIIIHANFDQHFSDRAIPPFSARPSFNARITRPQLSNTSNSSSLPPAGSMGANASTSNNLVGHVLINVGEDLPPQNLLRPASAESGLQRGGSLQTESGSMSLVSNPDVRVTFSHNGHQNPASQQLPDARHQLPQGIDHLISNASVGHLNPASQQLREARHQLPQGDGHMASSASVGHGPSATPLGRATFAQTSLLFTQVGNLRSRGVHGAPVISIPSVNNAIPPPTGNQADSEYSLEDVSLDGSDPREPLLNAPRLRYIPFPPTPPVPRLNELDDSGSISYWFEATPILDPNGDINTVKDAIYTGCLVECVIDQSDTTPVKELIVKFDSEDQEGMWSEIPLDVRSASISIARRHIMNHTLQTLYQLGHLSNVEKVEVTLPYAMWDLGVLSDGVVAHTPKLKTFHWDGHLSVFPKPWSRFANLPLRQLEHLKLTNCKLSLDDCIAILVLGRFLKTFKVDSLDENRSPLLEKVPDTYLSGCPDLTSLEITSCIKICPLLARIDKSQIRNLDSITLSLPVGSEIDATAFNLLPWDAATSWSLHVKSEIEPMVRNQLHRMALQHNKEFWYMGPS